MLHSFLIYNRMEHIEALVMVRKLIEKVIQ